MRLKHEESSIGEIIALLNSSFSKWSDTPYLDSQVLLGHIMDKNRAWILAHPDALLTANQKLDLEKAVSRLEAGEPLPYVLGHWEFFGLDFKINAETLIPRPETELMVEEAIKWLRVHPKSRLAADIGTGSGCVAVSLASHFPDLQITATDISNSAIEIAISNAKIHHVAEQIKFMHVDLLPEDSPTFNLILANLPYIPTPLLRSLDVFGKEPALALDGGPDGLRLIRRLLSQAGDHLSSEGLMLLEIEAAQGQMALDLAQEFYPLTSIEVLPDLAGNDRLLRIETIHE
jgi:release factor glutamine methyltransferase